MGGVRGDRSSDVILHDHNHLFIAQLVLYTIVFVHDYYSRVLWVEQDIQHEVEKRCKGSTGCQRLILRPDWRPDLA
jgi:hypothetical protein